MNTTIYFIRHAEPDYKVHDDKLRPLTTEGKEDAKNLIDMFRDIPIDVMISSPFKRAHDTIRPLADYRCLEVELINEFRERKVSGGEWIEDFNSFAKNQWADFDYCLFGGESLNTVQKRNIIALNRVIQAHHGNSIIIGSHGTALSTIINHFDSTFSYTDFNRIKSVMPWIVKFTFTDNNPPVINYLN